MDSERFDLIGELAAGFPSVVIAEQTIEVYARDLSDVPLDVLRLAVESCRRESRFFPTVSDIKEKAATFGTAMKTASHPDNCLCYGTGWQEHQEGGYKQVRRCDHVIEKPIGPPDPDLDVSDW